MSSRFVHVTVVPGATVSVVGPKLKLSILTSALDAGACPALAVTLLAPLTNSAAAATTGAAKTKIHTRLPMTFLPFLLLSVEFVARWSSGA
jgi:hypothetical protein